MPSYPEIAHNYEDLCIALDNNIYPAERHYLDNKKMLYSSSDPNEMDFKVKSKEKVHDELARNMASFGLRGGHLIYGVREDKEQHRFYPVEMDLPAHLDLAVVDIARTRIRPALDVIPHVLSRPDNGSRGFLVIEIPESATAPHMVTGTYYGRSEVGKVILTDLEVEEQILRRGRVADRLRHSMAETREIAESLSQEVDLVSHMMLTATPTQPLHDMFLHYTRDSSSQQGFASNVLMATLNSIRQAMSNRSETDVAFDYLYYHRRTSRGSGGAIFSTWEIDENAQYNKRLLGLSDNGVIRFLNLDVSSRRDGSNRVQAAMGRINERYGRPIKYQLKIAWQARDIIRLIGELAQSCGYSGAWLIGLEISRVKGFAGEGGSYSLDSDTHSTTLRSTTTDLIERPNRSSNELLRPLFRDLGLENRLPPGD